MSCPKQGSVTYHFYLSKRLTETAAEPDAILRAFKGEFVSAKKILVTIRWFRSHYWRGGNRKMDFLSESDCDLPGTHGAAK